MQGTQKPKKSTTKRIAWGEAQKHRRPERTASGKLMAVRKMLPRNAVEIPIYTYLVWRVWAPPCVLLGLPYDDVDDRIEARRWRLVAVNPERWRAMTRTPVPAGVRELRDGEAGGVDVLIENTRPTRRGPHRASGSMQLVLDIGLDVATPAIALMLIWRDLAIAHGNLGVEELRREDWGWWRRCPQVSAAVEKQKARMRHDARPTTNLQRAVGASRSPVPEHPRNLEPFCLMPSTEADRRIAAVVCARGAAARCGGQHAERLLRDAIARYAPWDDSLADIELPTDDDYVYHHRIEGLASFFARPGSVRRVRPMLTQLIVRPGDPLLHVREEDRTSGDIDVEEALARFEQGAGKQVRRK